MLEPDRDLFQHHETKDDTHSLHVFLEYGYDKIALIDFSIDF